MAKDPAFLFYSKDFYEGTRMLLPEERACYVDLLIYQHQNGYIPDDPKRMTMYCSGVDEATLQATLKAKFKQTLKGWVNDTLQRVMEERTEYANKQALNGRVGQLMKKIKSIAKPNEYNAFRDYFHKHLDKQEVLNSLDKKETTLEGLLKASLKHLANVNANEDVIVNKDKKLIPEIEEFISYAKDKKPNVDVEAVKLKYDSWVENGWKTSGRNSRKIKNWKSTLLNTLPHLANSRNTSLVTNR